MTWARLVWVRKVTQALFFMLYTGLLFAGVEQRAAPPLADIFFRLNPLSALSAMLASRAWIPRLALALLTVALTLLVGRVWCGWICPTGTLLEWINFRRAHKKGTAPSQKLRTIKYFLLLVILVAALFGSLTLLVFDPLALLTRFMTTAVLPTLNEAVTQVEAALYPVQILQPALDWIENTVRGVILPVKPPAFAQNVWIAALFVAILALNGLADRFWCRYLCPLGAFLGLLSKISLLRPVVGQACNHCTRCAIVCRPGAIQANKEVVDIQPSECTVCLDCLASCKKNDMHFRPVLHPALAHEYDVSRREALGALGMGLAGVLLLHTDLRARQPDPQLIRPPGAQDEADFLSTCLRCTQCMKICPTTALQPAGFEAGLEGVWTPMIIPRVGYCDYGCTACGQVCPSGAIPLLALEDKRMTVIGKASINRDRCLPWASNVPCIVCEEMCPTPQKSIRLEEVTVQDAQGEEINLQRPHVLREVCIGCGICENHCPLEVEAAIQVYSPPTRVSLGGPPAFIS